MCDFKSAGVNALDVDLIWWDQQRVWSAKDMSVTQIHICTSMFWIVMRILGNKIESSNLPWVCQEGSIGNYNQIYSITAHASHWLEEKEVWFQVLSTFRHIYCNTSAALCQSSPMAWVEAAENEDAEQKTKDRALSATPPGLVMVGFLWCFKLSTAKSSGLS